MIEHVWSILCSRSVIDRDSNVISLHEVVEKISLAGPAVPPPEGATIPLQAELVSFWSRQDVTAPARAEGRFRFIGPGGREIDQQEFQIDLTVYHRLRHRARILGLKFYQPGLHHFVVEVATDAQQWSQVARVPLDIEIRNEPHPEA